MDNLPKVTTIYYDAVFGIYEDGDENMIKDMGAYLRTCEEQSIHVWLELLEQPGEL